jgi:tRNA 2-thiocytidine biosynthesis protein TtcA
MQLLKNSRYTKLKNAVGRAIADFSLIQEGDRIAVGVSGGKDSYTLLHILAELQRRAPIRYELMAITIDSGYPGYRSDVIVQHLEENGFRYHLEKSNHFDIIKEKRRPESSFCSICARLKRGSLYTLAKQFGCNKLALGHHLDDFIETLLLNQFFVGSLKAMAPSMLADNGETTVIRPLVYVEEKEIIQFSRENQFPVVCCCCPVCGTADMQRKKMKQLLTELQKSIPHVKRSLLRALSNVQPRHLLDQRLQNFSAAPVTSPALSDNIQPGSDATPSDHP